MSALGQKQTLCNAQADVRLVPKADIPRLFDHLIGDLLQMHRHGKTEGLSGLEIDDELELGGLLDGKFVRLSAMQDAIGISRRAPKIIALVISVGQQAAELQRKNGADRRQGDGSEPPMT